LISGINQWNNLGNNLGNNFGEQPGEQPLVYINSIHWCVMGILSFTLFLIVSAAWARLAERLVPNSIPGGFFLLTLNGLLGASLGGSMVGQGGPDLAGVSLIPCILGSAVFVFLFSVSSGGFRSRSA